MRKTTNSRLPMPNVSGSAGRIRPGPHLSPKIAKVFEEITRASAPTAFAECDRQLLDSLAAAIAYMRQAQAALERRGVVVKGTINPLARFVRDQQKIIATLCTRLRISPQSRVSKERAATNADRPRNAFDYDQSDDLATLMRLGKNHAQ
jgi:hypothetical protein